MLRPMSEAPKEGTILALYRPMLYEKRKPKYRQWFAEMGWVEQAPAWMEMYWAEDHWSPYSGNFRTTTTPHIEPMGWIPTPDKE